MNSFQGRFVYFFNDRLTRFVEIGQYGIGEYFLENPQDNVSDIIVTDFINRIIENESSIDPVINNYGLKWNLNSIDNLKNVMYSSLTTEFDLSFDISSHEVEIIQLCGNIVNFVRETGEIITINLSENLRLFKI